ncbi:MAG: hypothetical protein ACOCQA_01695 [bacterium]
MSDEKDLYEQLQDELKKRSPFKYLYSEIYAMLEYLDSLEGEESFNQVKKNHLKAESKIIPDHNLKIISEIEKIKTVSRIIARFEKMEKSFYKNIDDQLDSVENEKLKEVLMKIVEEQLN